MPLSFDEIKKDRIRASRWLFIVAWFVEFCAAGIGFYFAIVTGNATREFMTEANIMGSVDDNVMLAMLPFFIVGIVELTKIPLAYAVYHARRILWRALFTVTLIILCLLTAETVMTGLERNLNNMMLQMEGQKATQKEVSDEIINLEIDIANIEKYSTDEIEQQYALIESQSSDNLTKLLDEVEATRRAKNKEVSDAEKEQTRIFSIITTTAPEELEAQKNDKQAALKDRRDKLAKDKADIRDAAQEEINEQQEMIDDSNGNIDAAAEDLRRATTAVTDATGIIARNAANTVLYNAQVRFDATRTNEDTAIKDARQRIEAIRNQEKDDLADIESDASGEIEKLQEEIAELEKNLLTARSDAQKTYDTNMQNLAKSRETNNKTADDERKRYNDQYQTAKTARFNDHQKQIDEIAQKRSDLPLLTIQLTQAKERLIQTEKSVASIANQIPVIRYAKIISGVNSTANVRQEDITLVMGFWFGSISIIAAITGTVIAFASFLLTDRDAFTPKPKRKTRAAISNTLRGLLIRRRRFYRNKTRGTFTYLLDSIGASFQALKDRLLRPVVRKEYIEKEVEKIVEVIKEVPVDRVVTQEVPKEIVRKEMVYVPFYSSEGGTLDISGQIKDLTNAEDIKKKISEITSSMTTDKDDHNE